MAYFTREKMVEMLTTLARANYCFINGPSGNDSKDLKKLIGCQQIAIALGEYIKSLGSCNAAILELIDNYCESVFDIAENLSQGEIVMEKAAEINALLIVLTDKIQHEIVEISSIDLYDFRGLTENPAEKKKLRNEIDRLIDACITSEGPMKIGIEFELPLVVGTY